MAFIDTDGLGSHCSIPLNEEAICSHHRHVTIINPFLRTCGSWAPQPGETKGNLQTGEPSPSLLFTQESSIRSGGARDLPLVPDWGVLSGRCVTWCHNCLGSL